MYAAIRAFRYLWAAPTTLLGALFVVPTLLSGGRVRVVDGVLEVHGRFCSWFLRRCVPLPGGASAMTLGHVVIACDQLCLDATRDHERVHVRQAERWGPLFVPAYFAASLIAKLCGRSAYLDNVFEREAYDHVPPPAPPPPSSRNT